MGTVVESSRTSCVPNRIRGIVARSPAMRRVAQLIRMLALGRAPIVISDPPECGKELVACETVLQRTWARPASVGSKSLSRKTQATGSPSLLVSLRAVELLLQHAWPGNLHELRTVMAHLAAAGRAPRPARTPSHRQGWQCANLPPSRTESRTFIPRESLRISRNERRSKVSNTRSRPSTSFPQESGGWRAGACIPMERELLLPPRARF